MTPVVSAAVVAGYMVLWAAGHTLLASLKVKRWARRGWGDSVDRWYRLLFVVVAVISLIPLALLWMALPDQTLYAVTVPWRWLMILGQLGALGALGVATLQAGVMHFLGLAQIMADDPDASATLQVHGLYRVTRHPLYLFSIVLIWLTPVMTLKLAALYGVMSLYFVVGSYHEERLLVAQHGEAYLVYRQRVPRFIPLPGRSFVDDGAESL